MNDWLANFLKFLDLEPRVFQAGPICGLSEFDAADNLGYIHVVYEGNLDVTSPHHEPLAIREPGLFLYLNPTDHQLCPMAGDSHMVCASFRLGGGCEAPLFQALPNVIHISLKEVPTLATTVQAMFEESEQELGARQAILNRLMEVVFIQILRWLIDNGRIEAGLLAGLADTRLRKAIDAMHMHPEKPWSVEELASLAGMSRARFAVQFRETVGLTPGNYLAGWRLYMTQSLLLAGKPLQQIADIVGYGGTSALCRAFKARVGKSPTDWLKAQGSSL